MIDRRDPDYEYEDLEELADLQALHDEEEWRERKVENAQYERCR